jgi:aspartate/methionine/tyrosine aminotransferase
LLSDRTFVDDTPNELARALASARAAGRPVLDLTESNPTAAGIEYDERGILGALAQPGSLLYRPAPFGIPEARAAVAEHLSSPATTVDPDRVVLVASTSEAYAFLFKLLANPGDEVLVPRPSYPLIEHIARVESVHCVPYRLAYDGAWHVDLPSVRAARSPRTRAILVVQPNNPTGSSLSPEELDAVVAMGLPIVSDEVFSSYRFPGSPDSPSVLESRAPLVFSLGGLSKVAGLPQVKLAWIAVGGESDRVAEALGRLEIVADTFLSVGTPVQLGARALLQTRTTAEQAIARRTLANLRRARAIVEHSPVSVLDVKAGWYAVLRLPRTRSEEAWALSFVQDDGVYVHPGHFFDFEDEAYVVASLLTREATFAEGLERIVRRVTSG